MGCFISTPNDCGEKGRKPPRNAGELAVFVPGLRIPKPIDFAEPLGDGLSRRMVERLSALRTRIIVMAAQEAPMSTKPRRTATQHGGSTLADLQQALEDYLPVLLGLVENGNQLQDKLQFSWLNQEDEAQETIMSNSWYEILSVLQMMTMLSLSQANLLLLTEASSDSYPLKVSEDCRRESIDIFLKAAGYLDFAVNSVLPKLPPELRKDLPVDLTEGVLRAFCLQALGQGVDIQLGMAIDSIKATLAVKRRFACELVKYWHQAQESIVDLPLANGWGEKHKLFIQWKYFEAKAAAYYLHGVMLDEVKKEGYEFLKESKKACESFHSTPPLSRNPPLSGTSKYLSEKIPKDISTRLQLNSELHNHEIILQKAPELPDFALSLNPDDYQLPSVDPSWNEI
ncbi:BRO1 domain containing protein [Melia azedarach]|uniref:BRO1 domain containing protein n=1 Tax=Melia azedarach TaxID=155640 RepID=A0ACC1XFS9_MELAZ|nr:BRO1 domain containing protein [Melia azedarach]